MKHQAYVVGLMFDPELKQVALIRKAKPDWQAGKLNGIGGEAKLEEDYRTTMVREFSEETGMATASASWRPFLRLTDNAAFVVQFYAAIGPIAELRTTRADEPIVIADIVDERSIAPRPDLLEDMLWIIPLALAVLRDDRPSFCTATCFPAVSCA